MAFAVALLHWPAARSARASRGNANSTRPDGAAVARLGEQRREAAPERLIVAQMERRDALVGQQVGLGEIPAHIKRGPQGRRRGGQVTMQQRMESDEQTGEAPFARTSPPICPDSSAGVKVGTVPGVNER